MTKEIIGHKKKKMHKYFGVPEPSVKNYIPTVKTVDIKEKLTFWTEICSTRYGSGRIEDKGVFILAETLPSQCFQHVHSFMENSKEDRDHQSREE